MAQVCLARLSGAVPAHVTRQRRQSSRVVWDLAGIGAAVIGELGAGRVASVNLTMARGRRLQRGVVGDVVDLRIGARVMALVCLARLGGVIPARVIRKRRQARRVVWDLAGIGAAVISELGASRVAASVNLTMGRVSSMG